jgi:hypothetical protein
VKLFPDCSLHTYATLHDIGGLTCGGDVETGEHRHLIPQDTSTEFDCIGAAVAFVLECLGVANCC